MKKEPFTFGGCEVWTSDKIPDDQIYFISKDEAEIYREGFWGTSQAELEIPAALERNRHFSRKADAKMPQKTADFLVSLWEDR